jgi:hypothetical protein
VSSRPARIPKAARGWLHAGVYVLGILAGAGTALAGGPLVLFNPDTRTPYAYPPGTVDVYTDLGPNGILTNDESDTLVARGFAEWTNVSSSYFAAAIAGEIVVGGVPTDITLANVDSIISTEGNERFNGGGIHVIYDSDGSITSGFFGAPPGVAGISSPEFADDNAPDLLESWTVLNGSVIDPGDTSPPGANFAGVYTHEFGHAINLSHSQCTGAVFFFLDNDGAAGCSSLSDGFPAPSQVETMYPYINIQPGGTGPGQATVDLLDDIGPLSDIYPAGGWPTGTGTISGTVFLPDSVSQISGVNVIARNLADPLGDCVSAMSGDYTQGLDSDPSEDGLYTLTGLTPGAQYVVYVDAIVDGGFPTTPTSVVFPEEYWNGAWETGDVETDTACVFVAITAAAGVTTTADIYLNGAAGALPMGDDDAVNVSLPFGFPFCGTTYNSVWIGSNGYVTFGFGDTNPGGTATALLVGAPRIAGLWSDLDPTAGGAIVPTEENGSFEIRFLSVPEFYFGGLNTFTITLRPNGSHRVQYGSINPLLGALAGRSPGGGASDPGPTDLSTAPQPLGMPPGNETVYEAFDFLETPDLSGKDLEYATCGYLVAAPDPDVTPRTFSLLHARPNPFRSATTIGFDLAEAGPVALRVFDIRGRLIRTLADEILPAGRYVQTWNSDDDQGRQVGPGIYFYRLETPGFRASGKTLRVQ